jgi:hypothetical protein
MRKAATLDVVMSWREPPQTLPGEEAPIPVEQEPIPGDYNPFPDRPKVAPNQPPEHEEPIHHNPLEEDLKTFFFKKFLSLGF